MGNLAVFIIAIQFTPTIPSMGIIQNMNQSLFYMQITCKFGRL